MKIQVSNIEHHLENCWSRNSQRPNKIFRLQPLSLAVHQNWTLRSCGCWHRVSWLQSLEKPRCNQMLWLAFRVFALVIKATMREKPVVVLPALNTTVPTSQARCLQGHSGMAAMRATQWCNDWIWGPILQSRGGSVCLWLWTWSKAHNWGGQRY